jgi:hypothetical protein
MCLFKDRSLIDGVDKQQVEGVAMGNCAAAPCAIIYMHHNPNKASWHPFMT